MKTIKKIEDLSRQSWLAGVGVLDSSRAKTVDNLDKLYVDSNAFVNELMARGELVEQELKAKFKGRIMIDEKIAALKAKLGMQKESKDIKIEKLSNKVDRLIEAVAVLAQQKEAQKSAAAKKAPAKPAASKAAAKPAAAKTTARKPATKAATGKTAASKTTTTKTTGSSTAKPAANKSAAAKAPAKPRVRKAPAAKVAPKGDAEE